MGKTGPRDSAGFKAEPAKLHQLKEDLNALPCFLSVSSELPWDEEEGLAGRASIMVRWACKVYPGHLQSKDGASAFVNLDLSLETGVRG